MADSKSWQQRFDFMSPRFVEHEVGQGDRKRTYRFYPASLRVVFRLKSMGKQLAKALSILFSKNKDDIKQVSKEYGQRGSDDYGAETTLESISVDLAKYRDARRDEAWDLVLSSFSDPLNQVVVAELIMDSLRDDCPRKPTAEDLQTFLDSIDVATLIAMLSGVAKANFNFEELPGKLKAALGEAWGNAATPSTSRASSPTASAG